MKISRYIVIAILLYIVFFMRLDSFHIRPWDESMYAVNAYEMMHKHHYFVPYYNGAVDYRNAKPVLAVWFQILSIKLFGFNELIIRLPSALAALLTAFFVFQFLKKLGNIFWAWCSLMVLITSYGFVYFHTARTGDTDSCLTLFLFLSNISFFNYIYKEDHKNRNIFLFFLFAGLAFGVKSVAIFLFTPAQLFMLFYKKSWPDVLKRRSTYIGLLTFLGLCTFFIMSRQLNDPTYIKNIIYDATRLQNVVDGHDEPFDFYFNNFYNSRFSIWCAVFVFSIIMFVLNRKEPLSKTIFVWAISLVLCYLTLISLSITKLFWYDMPLYPYLAIICGFGVFYAFKEVRVFAEETVYQPFMIILLFCIPLYYAGKHSLENSGMSPGERKLERIAEYLYTREKQGVNLNNFSVCDDWYNGQYLFYKYKLQEKGQNITIIDTFSIKPECKVIVSDTLIKQYIQRKFQYSITDKFHEVAVYEVGQRK